MEGGARVSLTWQQGAGVAAGGILGAVGLYYGAKWLAPRIGLITKPAAPTGLRIVTNTAVSAKNALLTVAVGQPIGTAAGATVTVNWYHYYPDSKGVLVAKLIGTTTAPEYEFTFGKKSVAGVVVDGVTPGRTYTWGAQICVNGVCSPIVQAKTAAANFAA